MNCRCAVYIITFQFSPSVSLFVKLSPSGACVCCLFTKLVVLIYSKCGGEFVSKSVDRPSWKCVCVYLVAGKTVVFVNVGWLCVCARQWFVPDRNQAPKLDELKLVQCVQSVSQSVFDCWQQLVPVKWQIAAAAAAAVHCQVSMIYIWLWRWTCGSASFMCT